MPQWPWEVYSHKQTSVITNNPGKAFLRSLIARITGPLGSDALDPEGSLAPVARGTPNKMTEASPLAISGERNGISLFIPRLNFFS